MYSDQPMQLLEGSSLQPDWEEAGLNEDINANNDGRICNSRPHQDGLAVCCNYGDQSHARENCNRSIRNSLFVPVNPADDLDKLYASHIPKGSNFRRFEDFSVLAKGVGIPRSILSHWKEAGFSDLLLQNLSRAGYDDLTPVQRILIPFIATGRDVVGIAESGTGKSAAYILPIISAIMKTKAESAVSDGCAAPVVVCITCSRELAHQLCAEWLKFTQGTGLHVVNTYGGTNKQFQLAMLAKRCDVMIGTPGRIRDWCVAECGKMAQHDLAMLRGRWCSHYSLIVTRRYFVAPLHLIGLNYGDKRLYIFVFVKVSLRNCKFFVVDEVDRMIEENSAAADLIAIAQESTMPLAVQTLMLSATCPEMVDNMAVTLMRRDFLMVSVGLKPFAANKDIRQEFIDMTKADHLMSDELSQLATLLKQDVSILERSEAGYSKLTMVFANSKRVVEIIERFLNAQSIPASFLHSGLLQSERERVLDSFKRRQVPVLVCTDLASRGLDIAGVHLVVNFQLPTYLYQCEGSTMERHKNVEAYIHRIGRAGRIGNVGKAVSFYVDARDFVLLDGLIQVLTASEQPVPHWLLEYANAQPLT